MAPTRETLARLASDRSLEQPARTREPLVFSIESLGGIPPRRGHPQSLLTLPTVASLVFLKSDGLTNVISKVT